jgi:hypothetical protein
MANQLRDTDKFYAMLDELSTHAIAGPSTTTLWNRLRNHRGDVGGTKPGGGNHRRSIFRAHVGTALIKSGDWPDAVGQSWRDKNADRGTRCEEYSLEQAVTRHIGDMSFLWLSVPERQDHQLIERNGIGLLSHRRGGVDEQYDPSYIDTLKRLIRSV